MTNAVSHTEDRGETVVPSNVGILVDVDENEESNEDTREASTEKLLEQEGMFHQVEGFGHIHEATVHIPTIPGEVADSLNDSPGAHVGGDTRLVGKLEVINPKLGAKENEDDPI